MSLSKASNNKHNRRSWEDSDFPILCETCLGDNPYVRMIRERYGKECKICTRLFTTFRWCPGHRMRFKKTEICQACSRMRNVCQTCVLDLVHGLPTQARDAVLNAERESSAQSGGKASRYKTALNRLRRTAPYYTRNRPRICSFWLRGECRRGDECPYRHEKSSSSNPFDSLREQNIKDRYFGRNDPVAKKMLERVGLISKVEPPMDKSLTTLYVGNLVHHITQRELHNVFYEYGDIRSISLITRQCCAFVQYNKRRDAELAIRRTFNKLSLKGRKATVNWARSQNKPVSRYAHTRRASRRSVEPDDLDLDATPPLLNYYANPYCA